MKLRQLFHNLIVAGGIVATIATGSPLGGLLLWRYLVGPLLVAWGN